MERILHSISYAGLWRGQAALSLEDFLEKAASLGFDGVELTAKRPHASPLDMTSARAADIRARLDGLGLRCACMAAYTDFALADGMVPLAEMQLVALDSVCALAEALGCPLVRVFTGCERPDEGYFPQYARCVEGLRAACGIAARHGVTVGIQNHHDIALDPPALLELVREIGQPNCKLCYDPWSAAVRGLDPTEGLEPLLPHVAYTTLADYRRVPRWHYRSAVVNYAPDVPLMRACGMGDGVVPNRAFLRFIADRGADVPVCYEMCSDLEGGGALENLDDKARRFLAFMREF